MAENGPKTTKSKPVTQNENDPILQGVDRVKSREELESRLASEAQQGAEDTHTKSNIHMGGRDDEGIGSGPDEDDAVAQPQSIDALNTDGRLFPTPDGGPQGPLSVGFQRKDLEGPEDPFFQSSGRATPQVDINGQDDGQPNIDPLAGVSGTRADDITPLENPNPELINALPPEDEPEDENSPPSTAPVDLGATDEDVSRNFTLEDLLSNATDPDGDDLTVGDVTIDPEFGQIIDNGDGTYTFEPSPDFNGEDLTITYTISDGTTTIPGTAIIDVLPVNDPPTSADDSAIIEEDTSYTFGPDDFAFSDIDGDSLSHITIVDLPLNGELTFNGNPVTAGDNIPVADLGLLVFTPDANENGDDYATFNFTVNDGADDSEQYTFSIDVTPVNDAPTSADDNAVIDEDTSYTFGPDDFAFNDIDGDSLSHITIVDLPLNGELTFNGNPVTAEDNIPVADLGLLVFTPDANENGDDYATFNFTVNDGTDDSEQYIFSIDVTPVNDAPTSADDNAVIDEDTSYTFGPDDFAFNDIDGDSFDHITVVDLPANGVLTFDGNPVSAGDEIPSSDLGLLVFTPDANENGDDYATFNFTVNDGADDSEQHTFSIDVTPVNDAPTSEDNSVSINEDGTHNFTLGEFAFADVDGDAMSHITITELPANGELTLSGSPVSAGDDIAPGDIPFLMFTPDENASGEDYGNFKFTVNDGTTDSGEYDFTIDVNAQADTPDLCLLGPISDNGGLYDISAGGNVTIDATYFFAAASFDNTHGFYVADSDGNPLGGAILQNNVKEGGTLTASFNTDDYPGGVTLGFFVIPNGKGNQPDLQDGDPVTFAQVDGEWAAFSDGTILVGSPPGAGAVPTPRIYFSDSDINDGNLNYVQNNEETGNQNWEDFVNGGDNDFNDVNTQVTVTLETCEDLEAQGLEGTLIALPDIMTELNDIDGSETLSVVISDIPDGVTLSDDQGNTFTATGSDTEIDVTTWNLDELNILPPVGQDDFVLQVSSTATENSNSDQATATRNINVDILHGPQTAVVDLGSTPEDTSFTFSQADLLINATDADGDALHVSNIQIDPAFGTITHIGNDVYRFDPTADFNGDDLAITYDITDGLVTINGNAIIDVTPVNDAPTSINANISTIEDLNYVFEEDNVIPFSVGDFAFEDVDGDVLDHITIVTLPDEGQLLFNDNPVSAGDDIPADQIDQLVFKPDADEFGDDYASFDFTVNDGELDSEAKTITIDVTPVNDAPESADNNVSTEEDTNYTFTESDFAFSDIDSPSMDHITIVDLPENGTLEFNGSPVSAGTDIPTSDIGLLVFIPAPGENGDDYASFNFTVNDGELDSALQTITVDVGDVNDGPVAQDDTDSGAEDTQQTGNVLTNDSDVDGTISVKDPGTYATTNGSITINGDGTYTYTPNANYNGSDSFDYTIVDDDGAEATATLNLTVTDVNDGPVANDDTDSGAEDTQQTGNVLTNDSDVDGTISVKDPGTYATSNGSITINSDGTYTYTPNANYHGSDSFDYTIVDDDGAEATATLNLTVTDVNDGPVAQDDTDSGAEDTQQTGNVLTNDSDVDGTISVKDPGTYATSNGSITINSDGTYTYTPNANYNGSDSFDYTIVDDDGAEATATLNLTVTDVNDGPVANDDTDSGAEDTQQTGNVLTNDSDVDGTISVKDPGTYATSNGSITINSDGTYTYTPNANYNGSDSFDYTIVDDDGAEATATLNLTVTDVNDGPVANDDTDSGAEDTQQTGNVLTNDSDVDGTISVKDPGTYATSNGSITINSDGTYTYTPNANYNGSDSFDYTIVDDDGAEATATLNLTVTDVNDGPVANDDTDSGAEDTQQTGNVLTNDSDVDGTISVKDPGTYATTNGSITINSDGTYTYTPNANYNGSDSFDYTIVDDDGAEATATLNLTITDVNDGPVANDDTDSGAEDTQQTGNVLTNDSDVDGTISVKDPGTYATSNGSITINSDGTYTYTPNANYNGSDSFDYTIVDDDGAEATATLNLTVTDVNDGPVANDDTDSGAEDTQQTGNVLTNDSDVDGTISVKDPGTYATTNGSITINGDGTYTYTPNANYNGSDSFDYTIVDDDGAEATATLNLTVTDVNDGPVAQDDTDSGAEDTQQTGNVLTNDSDVDGTISVKDPGTYATTNGSITINGDGTYTYTPNANYNGSDSFDYTIVDDDGAEATATLNLTVTDVNDGPVANDDTDSGAEDTQQTGNVLMNDSDVDGTISVKDPGTYATSNGSITINSDGTYTYTPNANYNGSDSFDYTIVDDDGAEATATLNLTITDVNDGPVANDDTDSGAEDTQQTGNVLTNDSDVDGTISVKDPGTYATSNGSITINSDGTYTYTPNANYNGSDSFDYTIVDDDGAEATATLNLTVTDVNDGPVANDDTDSGAEDTQQTGNVLTNDSDVDGTISVKDPGTYATTNGSITINGDGTYTYTPNANYNGSDSFDYTIVDDDGAEATATLNLTITDVNDGPVANDDTDSGAEDTQQTGNVLTNDSDVDGTISVKDPGTYATSNGSITINGDGTYTYTPNANYNGSDSFDYTIVDDDGAEATATLNLTVTDVNDGPVANDDTDSGAEDTQQTGNVLTNDSDVDGTISVKDPGTYATSNGSITINSDGTYTYTPNANYHGSDSFDYTIVDDDGAEATATLNLTVTDVNDGPVAQDDSNTGDEDTQQTGNVLTNDSDVDGTISVKDPGTYATSNGSITINGDGTYTYTPNANYHGSDSFDYTIVDDDGAEATATLNLTVTDVNDGPVAQDDTDSGAEDTQQTGNVLTNDSDVDGTISVKDPGTYATSNGSITINSDGTYTYTPNANYHGSDSFDYTIVDDDGAEATATLNLTVTDVNDGPVANDDTDSGAEDTQQTGNVLTNDSDVDGTISVKDPGTYATTNGSITINSDGTYTYTPNANYHGSDSFEYTIVDDDGAEATATLNLTVTDVNDGPVANDDTDSGAEDTQQTGNVLTNDSDVDGTISVKDPGTYATTNGSITINGDGTYTYTPNANYNGSDSFDYTIVDDDGAEATATLNLTVTDVNDGPVANDDTDSGAEDTQQTGNVLTNDSDVDGTISVKDPGTYATSNGSITINSDGTYTYTPNANYNGSDSFDYTIVDDDGAEATATLNLTVTDVNDGPVANDDTDSGAEDTQQTGNVLTNDSDVDGTISVKDPGTYATSNGSITINGDGTYTYTPNANYNGSDSFDYTIVDDDGAEATATLNLTVTDVNDGPVANDDTDSGAEDTQQTGNVLTNDSDVDGTISVKDPGTYATSNGSITINSDGTYTYTPNANYNGSDSFDYTIVDDDGAEATATLNLTVTDVNDGPVANDDTDSGAEDTQQTGNVLTNDSDVDGTISVKDPGTYATTNGSITINGDGTYTYTPNANYNGSDSFDYTIVDDDGAEATATLNLTITDVNDGPVANDDTDSGAEDTQQTGNVLTNDSDVDGTISVKDPGTYATSNGSITINSDGTYTYTPNANYNGSDSFDYTIVDDDGAEATATLNLTVTDVNDGPVANDDTDSGAEDTQQTGNVLTNDSDVDGTISVKDPGTYATTNGSITINSDGTYTYTPNANYNGSDSFDYTIVDDDGAEATATLNLTVTDVNDGPVAQDDTDSGAEDTQQTGNVLTNDSDVDGTISVKDPGTYATSNGSITINGDGTYTYTPNANYHGSDSFDYTIVDDDGAEATATLNLTVTDVNDGPVANDDTDSGAEDTQQTGNVLTNDSDVDGTISVKDPGTYATTNGSITINSDGTYTYTPNANYNGSDSFDYTIVDDDGAEATATLNLTVTDVNDGPVAQDDTDSGAEDTQQTGNVLTNDSDVDGTISVKDPGTYATTNGSITINSDGTYTYTPNANYNGSDSFDYTIVDDDGAEATATLNLTVTDVNDGPVAQDDTDSGAEDTQQTGNVLTNDSDVDGTISVKDPGTYATTNGSITISSDGTYTYTPNENYSGSDSFDYTIVDDDGAEATATLNLTVSPEADAPTLSVTALKTNVLTSGGESTDFSNTSNSNWVNSGYEGWSTDSPSIEIHDNSYTGRTASEGSQWFELNKGSNNLDAENIYRMIDTHENGTYEITLDISPRPGYDDSVCSIEIYWDGVLIDTVSRSGVGLSDNSWETLSYTVEGDGDPAKLEFRSIGDEVSGGRGMFLDNIRVDETISTTEFTSHGGSAVSMNIASSLTDTDGSEDLSLAMTGIPEGTQVSDGTNNFTAGSDNATVDITDWNLNGLQITPADDAVSFNINLVATSTESDGTTANTSQPLAITVTDDISDDDLIAPPIYAEDSIPTGIPNGYDERYGSNGSDYIQGDSDNEYIYTYGGNDTVEGRGGDDLIIGGSGSDTIYGQSGDDEMYGGAGNDNIYGGSNNDTAFGGSGNDYITGSSGEDTLYGESGDDTIYGGDDADKLSGGAGNDDLIAGSGDDIIVGGTGNDDIWAGSGNDTIATGTGDDWVSGASGSDTFIFDANEGEDTIDGGTGSSWTDVIQLNGFSGLNHEVGWTLVLDSGVVQSTDDTTGEMTLSQDADGKIIFDDGGSITFENVEKITW